MTRVIEAGQVLGVREHPASRTSQDVRLTAEQEWLAGCIGDPDQRVLVAHASGRVFGTVHIRMVRQDASRLRNRMTYAVVEEIVVCAGARRTGIGRRLMNEAVA